MRPVIDNAYLAAKRVVAKAFNRIPSPQRLHNIDVGGENTNINI